MVKWKEVSEIYTSPNERMNNINEMLLKKDLKIIDKCHVMGRLIIWEDLVTYLMGPPFWLIEFRTKSVIEEARKVTEHHEFR